jgi:hypothetical protein
MAQLMAATELQMAANSFSLAPDDAKCERLRLAAIAAKGKVTGELEQLRVAAERIAAAPRHNWPIAQEALGELLRGLTVKPAPAGPTTQPIICPHCNELSRPGRVCDVCGEEIQAEAAA